MLKSGRSQENYSFRLGEKNPNWGQAKSQLEGTNKIIKPLRGSGGECYKQHERETRPKGSIPIDDGLSFLQLSLKLPKD